MRDRREFYSLPPEHVRLIWCEWLRWHTIDPDDVLVAPGFIEIDTDACQIRYLTHDRDKTGRVLLTPDGQDVNKVVRVFQLEACPSEFPM